MINLLLLKTYNETVEVKKKGFGKDNGSVKFCEWIYL